MLGDVTPRAGIGAGSIFHCKYMYIVTFCYSAGILSVYVSFQLALWWIFHVTIIFWKVVFPLHARSFGKVKVKYIHMTTIIIGILLPLVPIITSMATFAVDIQKQNENSTSEFRSSLFLSGGLGFGLTGYPHILCSASNPDGIFYSFGYIVNVIMACGCTMFLIIVWSVHRMYKQRKLQVAKSNVSEIFNFNIFFICFIIIEYWQVQLQGFWYRNETIHCLLLLCCTSCYFCNTIYNGLEKCSQTI